jgi:hypothetical protein
MKRAPVQKLAVLLALLVGCSRAPSPAPRLAIPGKTPSELKKVATPGKETGPASKGAENSPANPAVTLTGEAGIVRAEVVWNGPAPLPAARPDECFVLHTGTRLSVPPPLPVEIDASTHGVAGVMAWLVRPPAGATPPVPGSVRLVQSRGVYRPAVQIVPPQTVLLLRSGDDMADFQGSGVMRFGRALHRGESSQVVLARTGGLTIRSSERPWMAPAHIQVLDHAFHALSGKDGKLELPHLPAGDYQVMLRHATAGKDSQTAQSIVPVKLAEGQGATIRWTLP